VRRADCTRANPPLRASLTDGVCFGVASLKVLRAVEGMLSSLSRRSSAGFLWSPLTTSRSSPRSSMVTPPAAVSPPTPASTIATSQLVSTFVAERRDYLRRFGGALPRQAENVPPNGAVTVSPFKEGWLEFASLTTCRRGMAKD
jgi:hypothetical protein